MYEEDDLVPLSALPQFVYCQRRCALIHIERLWDDNPFTVEGRHLHDRAHEPDIEVRGDVRIARGLRLHSLRLGLSGQVDVVEFHRLPDADAEIDQREELRAGIVLAGISGTWQPFPVEYKRGYPQPDICYEVQLCAQALCLEEMLHVAVPTGALFYGKPRRRQEVLLDKVLREKTETLALQVHELIRAGVTPPAQYGRKCRNCSLRSLCMPTITSARRSATQYLKQAIAEVTAEGGEQ